MIHCQIKKYVDNGEERFLQIEIIQEEQFNNSIIDVDGSHDDLFELYVLLNSDDLELIEERLTELIQADDVPTLSQLAQRGVI
tara:strand:- start:1275 stop:1523 length:249 start_codon:yes stop_codon:yes gene_type:complete